MKYNAVYFEQYYTRYYPSRKRLHEKIDTKVEDEEKRAEIKAQLESLVVEDVVLEDRVRNLLLKGKSQRYVRYNLFQKGFEKTDIERVLNDSEYADDFSTLQLSLAPKIERWIQQGKSRQEVRQRLFEYHEYKKKIQEYIDEVYPTEREEEVLFLELSKLRSRGIEKQKIVQRLRGRGFAISSVLHFLEK